MTYSLALQLWNMSISVAPVVIGALGSLPLDLSKWLKVLNFDDN